MIYDIIYLSDLTKNSPVYQVGKIMISSSPVLLEILEFNTNYIDNFGFMGKKLLKDRSYINSVIEKANLNRDPISYLFKNLNYSIQLRESKLN